jgi:GTP 3',8-cyclase
MDPVVDRLGRPLETLRVSITDRCNFRCVYCMPKEVFGRDYAFLDRKELLSFEEITRVVGVFAGLGVRTVRITGGEPLVRRDAEQLVGQLAAIPNLEIALTTNGALLPQKAEALARAGLSRVTVSLDSVDDAVFRSLNDVDFSVDRVLAGIDAASAAGLPVKVNAVVKRGANDDGVVALAAVPGTCCASSSTWTSATRTDGGSTTSCRRTRSSRASAPSGRSSPSRRNRPTRPPSAGGIATAPARSA